LREHTIDYASRQDWTEFLVPAYGSWYTERMAKIEELRALCFDETGQPKEKTACRAVLINHLILEEMMDVDEAEDLTEDALHQMDLWPKEEIAIPLEEGGEESSTDA